MVLVIVAVGVVITAFVVLLSAYQLGFGRTPTAMPSLPPLPTPSAPPTVEPTMPQPTVGTTSGVDPTAGPEPIVLAISLDGLNPDAITKLGAAGTPNLHRLINEGASTLNARASVEITKTLPNHTGMLTGRQIGGQAGHGVTFNDDNGKTLASTHGSYVPGMFDIAHDNGKQTAFFAEKDKFKFLMRSWDGQNGAQDVTGPDNGRDKTDIDVIGDAPALVAGVNRAIADGQTDLVFLHLAAPDEAGHADGWMSDDYLDAVKKVDASIGSILTTIDGDPTLRSRISVLVTADHGGMKGETAHDEAGNIEDYRIPFIAWGRGFPAGANLYAINPQRKDPGTGRPGYTGAQPIRNIDVADTSLELLGLPSIPGATASTFPLLVINVAATPPAA